MKSLKYIVVNIPEHHFVRVVFEDKFIDGNEFRTQNTIHHVLKLLGIDKFDVSLIYYDFDEKKVCKNERQD